MTEKIHWRKTAKICEKCKNLRSKKHYLPSRNNCVSCEWDEELQKLYKQCPYCRNFFSKEKITGTLCDACKKLAREKHSIFKSSPKLDPKSKHCCTICNVHRHPVSYRRGSDPDRLVCKKCETDQRIAKEGKFRCFHCGSTFPIDERGWIKGNGNYNCLRCTEKDRARNVIWQREWRKTEEGKEYQKAHSRFYWHRIIKPLYNKVFALQWSNGLLKKRRRKLDQGWYVLNRAMFEDFKKRPKYWYSVCENAIKAMRLGEKHIRENPFRNDPDWQQRMQDGWD